MGKAHKNSRPVLFTLTDTIKAVVYPEPPQPAFASVLGLPVVPHSIAVRVLE